MLGLSRLMSDRRRGVGTLLAMVGVAAAGAPPASAAEQIYTQTNTPDNQVVAFERGAGGTIRERGRVTTGGAGEPATPTLQPDDPAFVPILDSQGAVEVSEDGRLLFVVNAGSNTISSFRLPRAGLPIFVDRISTGGEHPLSLDSQATRRRSGICRARPTRARCLSSRGIVYAVNGESGTISGFAYSSRGDLGAIPGSIVPLSDPAAGAKRPAQIDINGSVVTVTVKDNNTIDTFRLDARRVPGAAIANPSSGAVPFGFAYDRRNHLLVTDSHAETASSYRLNRVSGRLRPINTDGPTGFDPCWVVLTPDERYFHTTDAFGSQDPMNIVETPFGTITSFRLARNGRIEMIARRALATPGLATDAAGSEDGRYLYLIHVDPFGTQASRIDSYRRNRNGSVTYVASSPTTIPIFSSGLAVGGTGRSS